MLHYGAVPMFRKVIGNNWYSFDIHKKKRPIIFIHLLHEEYNSRFYLSFHKLYMSLTYLQKLALHN